MSDYILIDGIKIALVHQAGLYNNKCAFLIHGFGSDKDEKGNFITLSEKLLDKGIDSIRIDLQGHGESLGNSEDMTVDFNLKMLEKIINKYSYSKVYLVGSSYGASLSVIYASLHNVDKMVLWSPLLDTARNVLYPENHFCKEFLGGEALKVIKEKGYATFGLDGKKFNENFYIDAKKYNPVDYLAKVEAKTLVLHGIKDVIVPYQQTVDSIKGNTNFHLELLDDANHCFWDDSKDEVIFKTVEFLGKED